MSRARVVPTTSEARIRELAESGLNWVQVAAELQMPVSMIRVAACALGITTGRGYRRISDVPVHELIDGMAGGETFKIACARLGLKDKAIYKWMWARGLPTSTRSACQWKKQQAA